MASRLKIFFDGGCRPNPGQMEAAVVAGGREHIMADLGSGTSREAEWLALLHALKLARSLGTQDFVLLGDAADVIAQATGVARPSIAGPHLAEWQALIADGLTPRIRHIRRTQNLAGIALSRLHPR